jgi:hypothetical protein
MPPKGHYRPQVGVAVLDLVGPDEGEQVDAIRPRPAPALTGPLGPRRHTVVPSDPWRDPDGRCRGRVAAPWRSHDAIPVGPRQRTSAACRAKALARDSGSATGSVSPNRSSRRPSANCACLCSANRGCDRAQPLRRPRNSRRPAPLVAPGEAAFASGTRGWSSASRRPAEADRCLGTGTQPPLRGAVGWARRRTSRRVTVAGCDLGVLGVGESATGMGAADRLGISGLSRWLVGAECRRDWWIGDMSGCVH